MPSKSENSSVRCVPGDVTHTACLMEWCEGAVRDAGADQGHGALRFPALEGGAPKWCDGRRVKDLWPAQKANATCWALLLSSSRTGIASGAVTDVDIVAHSTSGHALARRLCKDPVILTSSIWMNLCRIVPRRVSASKMAGIIFSTLHASAGTFDARVSRSNLLDSCLGCSRRLPLPTNEHCPSSPSLLCTLASTSVCFCARDPCSQARLPSLTHSASLHSLCPKAGLTRCPACSQVRVGIDRCRAR